MGQASLGLNELAEEELVAMVYNVTMATAKILGCHDYNVTMATTKILQNLVI